MQIKQTYTQEEMLQKAVKTLDDFVNSEEYQELLKLKEKILSHDKKGGFVYNYEQKMAIVQDFFEKPQIDNWKWCVASGMGMVELADYTHSFTIYFGVGYFSANIICNFEVQKLYPNGDVKRSLLAKINLENWQWGLEDQKDEYTSYYRYEGIETLACAISGILSSKASLVEKVLNK